MWLNSGLPEDACLKYPEISQYGMYRKLNDGRYEFIPYCRPEAQNYVSIQSKKFYEILDSLLPEKK